MADMQRLCLGIFYLCKTILYPSHRQKENSRLIMWTLILDKRRVLAHPFPTTRTTLRLQLNKISRLGSLIFGKNAKRSLSDIFGGDQISIPPVDETRLADSFPSRNHAQSSNLSVSESSPTRAQDSRELKINKKKAEHLHREMLKERYKLAKWDSANWLKQWCKNGNN